MLQRILASAIQSNPRVMKPLEGIEYSKAPSGIDQAVNVRKAVTRRFNDSNEIVVGFHYLVSCLTFSSGNVFEFESAIEDLGTFLGFVSQRPERDTDSGPDALWSVGDSNYFIIECKSEAKSEVWRRDAAQLAHSVSWFREKYDNTCTCIPILVHHSGQFASNANAPPDTRILNEAKMQNLHKALVDFSRPLAGALGSSGAVADAINYFGFTPSNFISRYTIKARGK